MKTLTIKTDLHCQSCVGKISPHLDNDQLIEDWNVDLSSQEKILEVKGEGLSKDYVHHLLQKEGYAVTDAEVNANQAFWTDARLWQRASFNTLNCLIGCSIGDFGMIIYLQAFYPQTPMLWQMVLAIVAGLCTSIALETVILKNREGFSWQLALKTAFGMSFISMVAMELAMTGTDFMITGGKAAFDNPTYWLALVPALIVGFLTPLPYNYYKLKKYNKACH